MFRALAEAVDIPVVLYNVPGRSGADLLPETTMRLAQVPGIVGIKDATGNIGRGLELLRDVPASFAVYSGDDPTAMALMFCGGAGNISVTANVAPRAMHELCAAAMAGKIAEAVAINNKVMPLHAKLFIEPNPVPVKWALAEMGMMPAGLRLPLAPLSATYHDTVRGALQMADVAGKPIYLGLAMNADGVVRLKPQNLLLNLPLAQRS